MPRSDDPAPFVPPGGAVSPPPPPPFGTDVSTGDHDDQLVTTGKPAHSVASMATEILSAAPRTQAPEPAEPAPTMLAEDVTIMARSRRRRFRLR
ncbi:MAG TPA: hypothetical protein VMF60_00505 [Acidimicrobiales bacterium]|nr:hypothetical protein [Acidimicrobiales bacterium]